MHQPGLQSVSLFSREVSERMQEIACGHLMSPGKQMGNFCANERIYHSAETTFTIDAAGGFPLLHP